MTPMKNTFQYYWIRFTASRQSDLERGEVSATTVVMAAALIALAIAVEQRLQQGFETKQIHSISADWLTNEAGSR